MCSYPRIRRHLLDEVLGALHVLPPARDAPPTTGLGREAKRPEDGADLLLRHRRSEEPVHVALAERHDARRGGRGWTSMRRGARWHGEFGHQRRGVVQHLWEHRPVDAALEPVRGLAVQLGRRASAGWRPGPSSPPRAAPGSSSSQTSLSAPPITPASAVAPPSSAITTSSPAAGDRRRPASSALAAVRAPGTGSRRAAVEVEGVQRVSGLEHHVVGDVDQVGDGANPHASSRCWSQARPQGVDAHALQDLCSLNPGQLAGSGSHPRGWRRTSAAPDSAGTRSLCSSGRRQYCLRLCARTPRRPSVSPRSGVTSHLEHRVLEIRVPSRAVSRGPGPGGGRAGRPACESRSPLPEQSIPWP